MSSALYLLSDEKVEKIATFDITDSLDLYDPRFGNAGSTEMECPVCHSRGRMHGTPRFFIVGNAHVSSVFVQRIAKDTKQLLFEMQQRTQKGNKIKSKKVPRL